MSDTRWTQLETPPQHNGNQDGGDQVRQHLDNGQMDADGALDHPFQGKGMLNMPTMLPSTQMTTDSGMLPFPRAVTTVPEMTLTGAVAIMRRR